MQLNKNIWIENKSPHHIEKGFNIMLALLLVLMISSSISAVFAVPVGPVIVFNRTENVSPRPAVQITTAGGTFTTLILNVSSQTPRWKAYVGNVSGRLVLDDVNQKSVFDWRVTSVTGEVYATRASNIDWASIACAAPATITAEDAFMNMSMASPDTINWTFSNSVHRSFYVGTALVSNSSCRAMATYVNDTPQTPSENAAFQEILLQDGSSNMVYSTLINQNTTGYNAARYDFQMIVAENEYSVTPTTYYLYVELI